MPSVRLDTKFVGLDEVEGALALHADEALRLLQEVTSDRARDVRLHLMEAMEEAYVTGTGRLATGVSYRTFRRADGIEVRFYITPYRELQYVTSLLGGYFQLFPVTPFEIAPKNAPRLAIRRDVGAGRVTVRLMPRGQPVVWGTFTGGFHRDVIKDVLEEEAELFKGDVLNAMQESLVRLTAKGGNLR